MSRKSTRLAAALVAAAAVAVPLHVGGGPAEAAATTAGHAGRVQIVAHLSNCQGCNVRLTSAGDTSDPVWQSKTVEVDDGGYAGWNVTNAHASNLSITLDAPYSGQLDFQPTVAFTYPGHRTGSVVTHRSATQAKKAWLCWSPGADSRHVNIDIDVHKVFIRAVGDKPQPAPQAYAHLSQPRLGTPEPVEKGVGGAQDVVFCG